MQLLSTYAPLITVVAPLLRWVLDLLLCSASTFDLLISPLISVFFAWLLIHPLAWFSERWWFCFDHIFSWIPILISLIVLLQQLQSRNFYFGRSLRIYWLEWLSLQIIGLVDLMGMMVYTSKLVYYVCQCTMMIIFS